MSKFFKRYRRQTIVKALKGPEPLYVIETDELMPALVEGRL